MFALVLDGIRRIIARILLRDRRFAPAVVTIVHVDQAKPSVAGFLQRVQPSTNFHLAARLASVSHLNTKSGRTPCARQRPDTRCKQIPKLLPRVVKRNAATKPRPRVATAEMRSPQPNIVTLTQPTARCAHLDIRLAQAA
jgi:hypothetical protein